MNKSYPNLRPFSKNRSNLLAIILIMFGVTSMGIWYSSISQQYRFDHDGVQVVGIVTGHTTSSGKSTTHFLNYQYLDSKGTPHAGSDPVPFTQWSDVHDMASVQVLYLRDDPDSSMLVGSDKYKGKLWSVGVTTVLCEGGGAFILFMSYRQSVKRRMLLNGGMCVERIAQVKRIEKVGKRGSRLIYEYSTDDGKIMVGYDILSRAERREWEAKLQSQDNAIPILYNRMKPSEHTITDVKDRLL